MSEQRNRLWIAMTHVEAMGMSVREIRLCFGVRRMSHETVEIKLLFIRWLYPFLKLVQNRFPGPA
jgi:hypothetical protein